MGIIIRYILRDLGVTFLFGFVALTCLLLIVGVVREALDRHFSPIAVIQMIPYIFAEMSSISLPVTLLLAVTIFFARMSGSNEVVALKALGIPPKAFLMPVFAITFFVSIIGVRINELAITWGRQGIDALVSHNVEGTLIGQLKHERHFDTPDKQITILVKGVDDQNRLIEPRIILKKEATTIEAKSAQISIDLNAQILTVTFVNFQLVSKDFTIVSEGERTHRIPLSEFMPMGKSSSASSLDLQEIKKERKKVAEEIKQQWRIIAAHRTFGAYMGSVDDWVAPQIEEARAKIRSLQVRQNKLSVEPPRRWATGFCCFFFVWLGAPLAIWMRKSDFFASFFACFVPILLLYYPLFILGLTQAKNGALPPMSVWTANAAIGLVGLWFLRHIHRY